MINNIKNEIKHFLKEYCLKVVPEIEMENYLNLFRVDHKSIQYEGEIYFIPEECSLMDENDLLLKEMLIATFNYEL